MGGFSQGFGFGGQLAEQQAAITNEQKIAARDAQAKIYENALNNPNVTPEQRQQLLTGYTGLFAPHEAPSLVERLAGLIHGSVKAGAKSDQATADALTGPKSPPPAVAAPTTAVAPANGAAPTNPNQAGTQTPAPAFGIGAAPISNPISASAGASTAPQELPAAAHALASGVPGAIVPSAADTAAAAEPPMRPMAAGHPFLDRLNAGIGAISDHLNAFAHPAQAPPPMAPAGLLAAAYQGPEAVKLQEMAATTRGQIAVQDARTKAALAMLGLRGEIGTPDKAYLHSLAVKAGYPSFGQADPEWQAGAIQDLNELKAKDRFSVVKIGGNAYQENTRTGERKLIGPDSQITEHDNVSFQPQPDGSTKEIHYTTYTRKGSNTPIADSNGEAFKTSAAPAAAVAGGAPAPPSSGAAATGVSNPPTDNENPQAKPAPVSSAAPASAASLRNLATKVNSRRTTAAPGTPAGTGGIVGGRPTPYDRSLATQFAKTDNIARDLESSYKSAQEAAAHPTPSSDRELIYTWVKANIKGAGRMNAAEFNNALKIGSAEQRVKTWLDQAAQGTITPELRNMMMADIERGTRAARQEAEGVRADATPGSGIPKAPQSKNAPGGAKGSLTDRLNAALAGK